MYEEKETPDHTEADELKRVLAALIFNDKDLLKQRQHPEASKVASKTKTINPEIRKVKF